MRHLTPTLTVPDAAPVVNAGSLNVFALSQLLTLQTSADCRETSKHQNSKRTEKGKDKTTYMKKKKDRGSVGDAKGSNRMTPTRILAVR